jgi:Zn-dependent protease with chaperone function
VHFILILVTLTISSGIRLIPLKRGKNRENFGQACLFLFAFPPLLLVMTIFAIVLMGYEGQMFGFAASKISYFICLLFLIIAIISLIKLSFQAFITLKNIKKYPQKLLEGTPVRFIDIDFPYTAQIGFWKPELVVSKGLVNILTTKHLQAVLAHEEAHLYYRDTFWFFWLSYLKNITFWLPKTENLWQELLLLRELRADQKATEEYDYLLLAESLLLVTQASLNCGPHFEESLACAFSNYRLQERIDALLAPYQSFSNFPIYTISWILLVFLPWFMLPFHN